MSNSKWVVKFAILCVLFMVPVFGAVAAAGYCVVVYRNCIAGKVDDDIMPEWEGFGDYFFKGVAVSASMFAYSVVFGLIAAVIMAVIGGPSVLAAVMGNGSGFSFGSIILHVVPLLACLADFIVCGSVFSYFAETLSVGSCFQIRDIMHRVARLGREYYIFVSINAAIVYIVFNVLDPTGSVLGLLGMSVVTSYCSLVLAYGVGCLVREEFHPELEDPTEIRIERNNYGLTGDPDEDEYGHVKSGTKHSASYWAGTPDSSLTWSTDSDKAER